MPESIHGHDVMQMMLESGKAYTRQTLRQDIVARFGEDARFHTCSAQDMTPDQIIEFLAQRGKFVDDGEGGFSTDPSKICQH